MTVDINTPPSNQAPKRRVVVPSYFRPLKKDMKIAGIVTGVILVLMIVGLPQLGKKPMDLQNPVIIDLVDLKDIKHGPVTTAPNTTRKQAPNKPAVRKEEPKEKPKPVKTEVKPPEPEPEKPKEVKPDPKEAAPKEELTLKPKKEKPKPEKPKKEEPKVEKPAEDNKQADFSSMLKNLVGEEQPAPPPEEEPQATAKLDESKPTAVAAAYGEQLTLSDMDALRQQLAQCWNVPAGAMDAENLIVDIQVVVRMDRTVESATIVDQGRYNSDTFYRAAADSARRAVLNPVCSPLVLPPDQYDTWKNMVIRFDPREMFGGF